MAKTETLEEFYHNKLITAPQRLEQGVGHFNVFRLIDCIGPGSTPVTYTRRDFYKVSLLYGKHIYHYADKSIMVDGVNLIFFNPNVPYTIERITEVAKGYFCIFTEAFFTEKIRGSLNELPMFSMGGKSVYELDEKKEEFVAGIFEKMLE